MLVTDVRYLSRAITNAEVRSAAAMRGIKDIIRRKLFLEQHDYPVSAGQRTRFFRRQAGVPGVRVIVAEWPADREIASPSDKTN